MSIAARPASTSPAHPRSLYYLIGSEALERFSFFGMQTLLVLYLGQWLLLPENAAKVWGLAALRDLLSGGGTPLTSAAFASILFGIYAAGVYVTPLIGGMVGDLLGRTRTIVLGAGLMSLGHFAMVFEESFLIAISCLLAGVGCFKGNIAAQVGALYAPDDKRRAHAFQLYFLGINAAVIVAPLVCGTLGQKLAWHWGFAAAGTAMVVALAVYLAGRPAAHAARAQAADPSPFTRADAKRLALLIGLLPILAMASIGNLQIYNGYLLWGDAHYHLTLGSWSMPVTWLISLDALISLACLAATLAFWRWWRQQHDEPGDLGKIAGGALIATLAPLLLALASWLESASGQKISLLWAIGFHIVNAIGYAHLVPVGLALFTRLAPARLGGAGASLFFITFFIGNLMVGWLGVYLEMLGPTLFWLAHAAIVGLSAAVLASFWVVRRHQP